MPSAITFPVFIKQCRIELGLTQTQLALRAGISISLLRKYESGARVPPVATAMQLADALGLAGEERSAFLAARLPSLPKAPADHESAVKRVVPFHLPAAPTPLLGREAELAQLTRLLRDGPARLVTLIGSPGVGKSRLALAAAAVLQPFFPDGVLFMELAALDEPAELAPLIAARLGAQGDHVEAALLAFLAQRSFLLVLDNFEQLLPAAPLVARLLAAAPRLAILVTSRVPLRLRAETRFPVKPLALPANRRVSAVATAPATRLFCERAVAVNPAFTLNAANATTIAALCQRLDGLPLAIELAAARADMLEPAALLASLDAGLAELAGGFADLPAHQRSLQATIAWSEQLLAPATRDGFARLGVFQGAFDATAAAALGVDDLDQLVDAGLVQCDENGWFHLLETIRAIAVARLQAHRDADRIRASHAMYYAALAETACLQLDSAAAATALAQLDASLPNLRAAIRWSLAADGGVIAARITAALRVYWLSRRAVYEGRLIEPLLASPQAQAIPLELRGSALITVGYISSQQGAVQAGNLLAQGIELARQAGNMADVAQGLAYQGMLNRYPGNQEVYTAMLKEAIAIARRIEAPAILAYAMNQLGVGHCTHGRYHEALPLLREAVDLVAQSDQIMVHRYRCDLAEALRSRGDLAPARRMFTAIIAALAGGGDAMALWEAHLRLASIDLEEGALASSARNLAAAGTFIAEMSIPYGRVSVLRQQGYLAIATGRDGAALADLNMAQQEACAGYLPEELSAALIGLAYLNRNGDRQRAARLCGAAEGILARYQLRRDRQAERWQHAVQATFTMAERERAHEATQLVIDYLPQLAFANVVAARDTVRLDRVIATALRG
ncbi:MAG: helix-turn-helix domain-containing protein [Chloroflexus sp.]|nr:helix-turn-helix domain-containing protein [Chloroflexus sp.]